MIFNKLVTVTSSLCHLYIKLSPKVRMRGRPKGAGLLIPAVVNILVPSYLGRKVVISINAICEESTLDTGDEYTLLLQNAICSEIKFSSSW